MTRADSVTYRNYQICPLILPTTDLRFVSKVVIVDDAGGRRTFGTLGVYVSAPVV